MTRKKKGLFVDHSLVEDKLKPIKEMGHMIWVESG